MKRSLRGPGLVALPLFAAATVSAQQTPGLSLEPCEIGGVEGPTECGTLTVYEDREARSGRMLELKVVVVVASDPNPEPDPIYVLTGGPGSGATGSADGASGSPLRAKRSYVLMDQRGTGASNGLFCLSDDQPLEFFLGPLFNAEQIEWCREELEPLADLRLYATSIAMDDLDDLRRELGHEKINLWGTSYGTRAALVYLRRHGEHVRSAVLNASVSMSQVMPMGMASDAEAAIRNVIHDCAAMPACAAAYPDLEEDYRHAVAGARSPVQVSIQDPRTGVETETTMRPEGFAEALRAMLYSPGATRNIPHLLHLAATEDDYDGFATFGSRRVMSLTRSAAMGLYLSITCAEDIPFANEAGEYETAKGTFLADNRARPHFEACRRWPQGSVPANFHDEVESDVPVLLLNGAHDPVTPPSRGSAAASRLRRSFHVVVPHGGHGFGGLEGADCVSRIRRSFVEDPTNEPDTACLADIRRQPFRD